MSVSAKGMVAKVSRISWIAMGLAVVSLGAAETDTRLVMAAQSGEMNAVLVLLKQRVDVNVPLPDGTTALHWAVRWNSIDAVDQLIRAGANVNAVSRYHVTPLALACTNGSAAIAERLLQAGANPNASSTGEPPIMVASRTGDVETIKVLLAGGAPVNATETERGQTALMWAVAEGNAEAANVLIEHGADVNARSRNGFTPLLFAVRKGDASSVRTLLAAGASPNEKASDGTPVAFVAIMNGHYELAAALFDHGADPDGADKAGRTALHAIIATRSSLGAQFQYTPPPTQTGSVDSAGLMGVLLARGANPNARMGKLEAQGTLGRSVAQSIDARLNLEGATPWLLAAQNADVEMMRLLLGAGADPQLPTSENSTPLMAAAGLSSRPRQGGPSPAAVLEAVRLTLDLGNDVNAVNVHGQTPLHGAVYRGLGDVIQLLVDRGAKLDAKDVRGRTPAALADDLSETLISAGRGSAIALLGKLTAEGR